MPPSLSPRLSLPWARQRLALVVDDSAMMRRILRRALELRGFEVLEAENGKQALDLLALPPTPALALIDWRMPEMDGLELVRQLRESGRFGEMAIIMVTSETAPEQIKRALDSGCDEYVMKPLSAEILSQKLWLIEKENSL